MVNYYKVMGLPENATEDQIKQTYRTLAKKYHPDLHPGDKSVVAKFEEIGEAAAVLGDKQKRAKYDEELKASRNPPPRPQVHPQGAHTQGARTAGAHAQGGARPMGFTPPPGVGPAEVMLAREYYRRGYEEAFHSAEAHYATVVESWRKRSDEAQFTITQMRAEQAADKQKIAERDRRIRELTSNKQQETEAMDEMSEQLGKRIDLLEEQLSAARSQIYEGKEALNKEREARLKAEADMTRLANELAKIKNENSGLKDSLNDWEEYGQEEEENENLHAICDKWEEKLKEVRKQYKKTHYGTLGVPFWATKEEISDAFDKRKKRLSKQVLAGDEEYKRRLKAAADAFKVLSSATARNDYDLSLGISRDDVIAARKSEQEYFDAMDRLNEKAYNESVYAYIDELIEDATAGDGEAALTLGAMYLAGESIAQNAEEAVHWFEVGAENGCEEARYYLGLCYLNGEGVATDAEKGAALIKQAAEGGCPEASDFILMAQ
ncbi:MAG: DnaJ domain-containing protein [Clostridiales bacterium]|nr:DnaJ domain-containing protein [Clostridiales bacterium]